MSAAAQPFFSMRKNALNKCALSRYAFIAFDPLAFLSHFRP
jgi:hypothetical protein